MLVAFLYLFLGIFIANWGYYLTRNRESHNSPIKGSLKFYLKDNWVRLLHSVPTAIALCLLCNIRPDMTSEALHSFLPNGKWLSFYTVAIGIAPEGITALLKSALKWMQPGKASDETGKIYNRK